MADWAERVERRTVRVGIVGMGYVGLPLALLFSESGFGVVGFDVDAEKVRRLEAGESYIHRIGAEEIRAARARLGGRGFSATADFSRVREVDAVLICVPTPLGEGHVPDLSYVRATVETIAPWLRAGQMVVLESTTYPGTTEEIVVETIDRVSGVKVVRNGEDDGMLVAFSPEREDPGNVTVPRRTIPKVVGGVGQAATAAACALYGAVFDRTVAMSSPAAAEMTKLLENIYRNVNIALVNEMKQLCAHMGVDVWEVIEAAKTKPFGFQAFYPGPGVGGHCIPVDPFYLSWKAAQMGFAARFIALAGEVNEAMPGVVVEAVRAALTGPEIRDQGSEGEDALQGASVLVLGVAYKRDVDDLRESPALVVIELLRRAGAHVEYNDPYFAEVGRGRKYALGMRSTPVEEVGRFDCVAILTDHSSYDWEAIVAGSKLVVDSRNATRGIASSKIVRC